MSHDAESQLKFTLDGLVNHLWIFTILFILAEKDVLQDLCHPTPLPDLIEKIGLNKYVLNNMFDVLKE